MTWHVLENNCIARNSVMLYSSIHYTRVYYRSNHFYLIKHRIEVAQPRSSTLVALNVKYSQLISGRPDVIRTLHLLSSHFLKIYCLALYKLSAVLLTQSEWNAICTHSLRVSFIGKCWITCSELTAFRHSGRNIIKYVLEKVKWPPHLKVTPRW